MLIVPNLLLLRLLLRLLWGGAALHGLFGLVEVVQAVALGKLVPQLLLQVLLDLALRHQG